MPVGSPVLPPPLPVRPPVLPPRGAAVDQPALRVVILDGIIYTREDIVYSVSGSHSPVLDLSKTINDNYA
ncbi:hypothetical protein Tco_0664468 [Tanacetum coccineum]